MLILIVQTLKANFSFYLVLIIKIMLILKILHYKQTQTSIYQLGRIFLLLKINITFASI